MKKIKILFVAMLFLFSSGLTQAQEWLPSGATSTTAIDRTANVGIGSSSNVNHKLDVSIVTPLSGSHTRAINGNNPVVNDKYTYGVQGVSYSSSAKNSGRSYGLYGVAGNATSNYNYGVTGTLIGTLSGAGIVGVDQVNYPGWSGYTDGSWAGYFRGDGHISSRLTISTTNMPTTLGTHNLADYKLFVCGGILASELLIESPNWCDYVFEKDYELLSLEAVDQHIQEKGYLHKTPSAEEVENNGLEISKTTINQQEKIEEIFLHLIEMNKEIKALKAENTELKNQLEAVKK